jgi:hypothetical protein
MATNDRQHPFAGRIGGARSLAMPGSMGTG